MKAEVSFSQCFKHLRLETGDPAKYGLPDDMISQVDGRSSAAPSGDALAFAIACDLDGVYHSGACVELNSSLIGENNCMEIHSGMQFAKWLIVEWYSN